MFTSVEIPHLAVGQSIVDYKKVFLSATATLEKDAQRIACLPLYINRTEGEKQIAFAAAAQDTLEKAFKFLEEFIDGVPCVFSESSKFFDMKPKNLKSMDSIRSYYFELLEVSNRADISGDTFLKRFFTNIPGGKKIMTEVESDISPNMSATDLLNMFKKIMPKIQKKISSDDSANLAPEEQFVFPVNSTLSEEAPPAWAISLQKDVNDIRARMGSNESGFVTDDEPQVFNYQRGQGASHGKKKKVGCQICGKKGHKQSNCFKRTCENCQGTGHDAEVCPSYKIKRKAIAQANPRENL